MLKRYIGDENKRLRIEQLKKQKLVAGSQEIAEKLESLGTIEKIEPNYALITADDTDNDVYFILSGSMTIFVNGNIVAKRVSGDHVGEMVVINPESKRTTTVQAAEESVVLKIKAADFTNLLDQYPAMCMSLAKILAKRLHDRGSLMKPAHEKISIFIISSVESLDTLREIENAFDHDKVIIKSWTHNVFKPSNYALDDLIRELDNCDFAIAIANGDDHVITRGKRYSSPRDNVIFELGMAIGKLGRERTFLIEPRDKRVHLPSDMSGFTPVTYENEENGDLTASIAPACNKIRSRIKELGIRPIYP